jgi:hypothetical protein
MEGLLSEPPRGVDEDLRCAGDGVSLRKRLGDTESPWSTLSLFPVGVLGAGGTAALCGIAAFGAGCDDDGAGCDDEAEPSVSRYLRVCWAANCFAFCTVQHQYR